jgi:hypothetical protein
MINSCDILMMLMDYLKKVVKMIMHSFIVRVREIGKEEQIEWNR